MCRSCAHGGRRCPSSEASRGQGRASAARYYKRGKARQKIAELADAGIPALGDTDLPATYHQHATGEPVTLDGSRALENPDRATIDKPSGALWSSPGRTDAQGAIKTAWTDWAAIEDHGKSGQLAQVQARPGAVIVTMNDARDAEAVLSKYGTEDTDGRRSFDWVAMREDGIDGVHVSDKMAATYAYSAPGKHGAASNLAGWSAGSVAWLSTDKLEMGESQQPGAYEYQDDSAEEDENRFREVVRDEGMGTYDEPSRPDLDTAWDRVPPRFKPTPDEPAPAPAQDPEPQGVHEPQANRATGNAPGGRIFMPSSTPWIELGVEAAKFAAVMRSVRRKKSKRKGSR